MSHARQLELAFEVAPRWDPCALESALAREAGRPLQVVLTDNRSVLLSVRRRGAARWCGCTACSCTRRSPSSRRLARNIRRHGPRRRRRGAPLHEREPAPRAPHAAPAAAARHARPRPRPGRGVRADQPALLRRPDARADHLGPRRRPRAAQRPHLRQLRPGARAHPHPPGARPRDGAALLPRQRRAPRDAAPPAGRGPRPRGAHRVPHARLPRGGGALPAPPAGPGVGEGEPAASCCARARPSTASGGPRAPPHAPRCARRGGVLPQLRRLLPGLRGTAACCCWGSCRSFSRRRSRWRAPGCCATRSTT